MGSELVGVTVGEAQNPRKNVPRGKPDECGVLIYE